MSLATMLNQSCTITAAGALDKFAHPTYGSATTYSCRFEATNRSIVTPQSEKTQIDAIIFLDSTALANINDKLVFNAVDYRIMLVSPIIVGSGTTHHLEVMVQKWNN